MRHIANIITSCRILCSIMLLFFSLYRAEFWIFYFFCGFSDILDGFVARRTNSTSIFGAKFDTVADFIFVAVFLIKLLMIINISVWLKIWIVAIAVIKIASIVLGFIHKKKLIVMHTTMNKAIGLLLFFLPLILYFVGENYGCTAVCIISTISALQELYYIGLGREVI